MQNIDRMGAECEHIRPFLKEIDEGFDIEFDYIKEKYRILHNGNHFSSVYYKDFDRSTIADIAHTMWLNKKEMMMEYIEKQNEQVDLAKDKNVSEMARNFADDTRRLVINDYYYGG